MQVRPYRADRHAQHRRNLLIRPLFLMVEHQYRPLNRAQLPQRPLHPVGKLALQQQLFRIARRMPQPVAPVLRLIRQRGQRPLLAMPPPQLVLRYVHHDAV